MTTLITGGTGKTGSHLARLLNASNHSFLIATRSGVAPVPFRAVKFDWHDPASFENPFQADQSIDKIFIVLPPAVDPLPIIKEFTEVAVKNGVKRFVLLSSTALEKGDFPHGKAHEYLADSGFEYAVLRPTWFMDNFSTNFYLGIRKKDEVVSVAGDGRIPFVAAEDIAQAAYDVLVSDRSPNTDYYVLGPELYSYDEATEILSKVLGRKITHKRITNEEEITLFESFGIPKHYAALLNSMEAEIAKGSQEALVGSNKAITGKKKLREYFEEKKQIWLL